MAKILVSGYIDPDQLDTEHRDDGDRTGLSEEGFNYFGERFAEMGIMDPDFVRED